MSILSRINIDSFNPHQASDSKWRNIPIQFLDVFRKERPTGYWKYQFSGTDPKGNPSKLKMYADTFSVYYRTAEVEKYSMAKLRTQLKRSQAQVEKLSMALAKMQALKKLSTKK